MTLIESKMEKNYDSRTERANDNLVNQNKIIVFMKGTKLMPQWFSNNVVQIRRWGTLYNS